MFQNKLASIAITVLAAVVGAPVGRCASSAQMNSAESVLGQIRTQIQQRLAAPAPKLYKRHLQSVLALCEESVLQLQLAGSGTDAETEELLGYLKAIESGLGAADAQSPETYLAGGMRSLDLARVSRSDGTLQFYLVGLPARWNAGKSYPLHVYLHGRESDLPLSLVASTFAPENSGAKPNDKAIIVVPWLRGNGQWREGNGSEPDVWEAIDDVKTFAKIDPDRQYISGHSWGGDDVWAIVLRTPDLWAGAGIMAGSPASVPPESNLYGNARYVPFYLWKGERDPIPNRQANLEYFRDSLTQAGDPPQVVIAPGVGHNPRPEDRTVMETWLFEHIRHRPDHFTFVIDTPQHRGIWGVSIPQKYPDAYLNLEPRVSFECWIEGSTVKIRTENTNRLDVDLGTNGLNLARTVRLIINGKQMFEGAVPAKPVSLTW